MNISKIIFLPFAFLSASLLASCEKELWNKAPVVDAGDPITVNLPKNSTTLSATAADADGEIVSYLWSKVSGPGVPVIANPGSSSTVVGSLEAGEYVFQVMVTDDKGLTGVDTVSIIVLPAQVVSKIIQPGNNLSEVHIWGNNADKEQSGVNSVEIGGVAWTHYGDPIAMRAALKFDFSNIPSAATIVSAKLTLYSNPTPLNGVTDRANSGNDNTLLIQRITSSWVPSSVTWNNQPPATSDGQIVIPHTNEAFLDLVDIDVTDFVDNMIANDANYGFLIRLKTESIYTSRIFCSSKYTDASKHPKLEIIYTN